jgi:hypothetical protein
MPLSLKISGSNLKSNNNNPLILAIKRPDHIMSIIFDYVPNNKVVYFEKIKKTIELDCFKRCATDKPTEA